MKPRTRLGLATVVLGCFALLLAVLLAPESVDFSLPPPEGLTVLFTSSLEIDSESLRDTPATMRRTWTHDVVRVDAGHVVEVQRLFHDDDVFLAPVFGLSVAGCEVHYFPTGGFRAAWSATDCSLEHKGGDTWTPVEREVQESVSLAELRSPVLPLGRGARRVGDDWEVSARALFAGMCGSGALVPEAVDDAVTCRVRFDSIVANPAELRGRYALLRVSVTLPGTNQHDWEGRALYDLTNRIIADYDMAGSSGTGKVMFALRLRIRTSDIRFGNR